MAKRLPTESHAMASSPQATLARSLTLPEAVLLGLGSILGTGVFVSIGVAAGVAGPAVILATALAALLATANALNSAQLAASHPVSGGTYEYGYRFLTPSLGFSAGWMFLCAKSASAATAALGFAGYFAHVTAIDCQYLVPIAVAIVVLATLLVLGGIRRSSFVNAAIVGMTLLALFLFCVAGMPVTIEHSGRSLAMILESGEWSIWNLLQATALMFVAYTGYGRIATLSEEVVDPRRTIPRAIIATLIVSALLYVTVAVVAIAAVGSERLAEATQGPAAPLAVVAAAFDVPGIATIVALGAVTAMLGVLLNLVLGLSRVVLAMARRGDLPQRAAHIDETRQSPGPAVVLVGVIVTVLTLIGDVKTTWSFSAFTVLVYYGITNLAALQLPAELRLYPRWLAVAGLIGCFALAFFVEPIVWASGLGLLAVGLAWHVLMRRKTTKPS